MIAGNRILKLDATQLQQEVPMYYKERYWLKTIDENDVTTYTPVTWDALTNNNAYRLLNGKSPIIDEFTYVRLDITEMDEIALRNDGYQNFTELI